MNPEAVGAEIKKVRIEKGMGQKDLAEKAKMAQGRISMIENGKYPGGMNEIDLKEILDALGVTYEEIMGRVIQAEAKGTRLDEIYKKVSEIYDVIFDGNGTVKEFHFAVPKGTTEAIPLPLEFNPYLAVELKEKVGEFETGDTLFFMEMSDEDDDLDDNEIVVFQNRGEKPQVLTYLDYKKWDEKDKPDLKGYATHALKRL